MDKDQEGPAAACPVLAAGPSFICVTAKAPGASAQFVLPADSTVREFKEELAKHFDCAAGQLVLVFFGRILKDHNTLRDCGVGDGMTVHLVIRTLKRDQEDLPLPPYAPRPAACAAMPSDGPETPTPFSPSSQSLWGPQETGPPGAEWQLVPTSERIVQKVRQVILANPEVQQLAQQIPAISHILNNMDIMRVILDKMREIVDLARNPDMLQDLKCQDQPLMGLQSSIPGGDNPLRQLNSEIPEPGLSAGPDLLLLSSPYTAMWGGPEQASGLRGPGPSTEARDRLESLPASRSCTSVCSNGSSWDDGGLFHTLANPLEHGTSMPSPEPSTGTGRFQAPDAAEIPTLIVNLCNAYTKRMMFSLMQNALLASQGTQGPAPEQTNQQIRHFAQQMQSPEMVAAMSNPRATQAWVQMEQGLQTLAAEAPVLIPWFALRLRGLGCSSGVPAGFSDSSCPESAASE